MDITIIDLINRIDYNTISDQRKDLLKPLQDYLSLKVKQKTAVNLNFICTHNSRRSQLSQVWAKVIGDFYGHNIDTFSGGLKLRLVMREQLTHWSAWVLT